MQSKVSPASKIKKDDEILFRPSQEEVNLFRSMKSPANSNNLLSKASPSLGFNDERQKMMEKNQSVSKSATIPADRPSA